MPFPQPQVQPQLPTRSPHDLAPDYAPTLFEQTTFEQTTPLGIYQPRTPHLSLVPPMGEAEATPTARVLEERWYQTKALAEIDELFPPGGARVDGKGRILVAPTAAGKTSIASRAIKKWRDRGENVLVLVNLDRLLEQMLDDLRAEGIEPIIEKAEHHALTKFSGRGDVVLASCQSLHPRRLARWPKDSFQHIVCDECFPYSTPILTNCGWMPIGEVVETKAQVSVASCNPLTHELEWKPVVRHLTNSMKQLVRVNHENGSFICTPEHKIWTENGYVKAGNLVCGTHLRTLRSNLPAEEARQIHSAILQSSMREAKRCYYASSAMRALRTVVRVLKRKKRQAASFLLEQLRRCASLHQPRNASRSRSHNSVCAENVRDLQQGIFHQRAHQGRLGKTQVLFGGMRRCVSGAAGRFVAPLPNARINARRKLVDNRSHVSQQSDERCRYRVQSNPSEKRQAVRNARRQRTINEASARIGGGVGRFVDGISNRDGDSKSAIPEFAVVLQSGHCRPVAQTGYRSGREQSFGQKGQSCGRIKNFGFERSRVVSVEVYEPASDGELERLCGGRENLYDIEVADNHNYFANGTLVSNCHEFHWRPAFLYFETAQVLGLTATPFPPQGKSLKKYFHYPYIKTLTLIEAIEGWNDITKSYDKPFLSRIKIQPIDARHIDLSAVKIVGKDFDARELDRQIWTHTNEIASDIIRYSGDRPTFVFCPRVQTAEAIAAALRDMGAAAESYTSNTPNPKSTMAQFERGDLQHLVSVNMLIKGVNVRKVSCIARVRATLNVGQATQEIGRGTRLCPEAGKEDCLILEFNFKTGKKHQLASVVDAILTGDFDPEAKPTPEQQKQQVRLRARTDSLLKSGKESDVLKATKEARKQLSDEDAAARKARDDARRAKYQQAETNARQRAYDPCVGLNKVASTTRDSAAPFEPATSEQLALLSDLSGGAIKEFRLSSEAADARIAQLHTDRQLNRASEKQKKLMIDTLGFDPRKVQNMPKWVASKAIEARRLEIIHDLGERGYQTAILNEAPIWELARMHNHVAPERKEML